MSWVATGAIVMAGGSLYSSYEQNKQTGKNTRDSIAQANAESKANAKLAYETNQANAKALLQSYNVSVNNLNQQAQEFRNLAGMELTQAKLEGLKNEATTSAVVADRGIVGSTASRLNQITSMNTELLSDQIRQKADSNMVDIMNKLTESRYSYENGILNSALNYANATTQISTASSRAATQIDIAARAGTVSTVGAITGGISAGAQGYSLGKSFSSGSSSSNSGSSSSSGGSN